MPELIIVRYSCIPIKDFSILRWSTHYIYNLTYNKTSEKNKM